MVALAISWWVDTRAPVHRVFGMAPTVQRWSIDVHSHSLIHVAMELPVVLYRVITSVRVPVDGPVRTAQPMFQIVPHNLVSIKVYATKEPMDTHALVSRGSLAPTVVM
jgi:hypothetical protein